MKLVLTLQTLERLIADDEPTLIELRKSTVHEFSKRYLSTSATKIQELVEQTKQEIFDQVLDSMGAKRSIAYTETGFVLSSEARSEMRAVVKAVLAQEIQKYVLRAWEELKPSIADGIRAQYNQELIIATKQQVRQDIARALTGNPA